MANNESTEPGNVKTIKRIVSFVGICILLLSQLLVFSEPIVEDTFIPPYTHIALLGISILLAGQAIPSTPFWQRLSRRSVFQHRTFWIIAALLLSGVATLVTEDFMKFQRLNYLPVLTIWLIAGACYTYALLDSERHIDFAAAANWIRTYRIEILVVLLITLFAAAVRFYKLGEIPRVLDGDEGLVGISAESTLNTYLANPFALWENFGGWYLQLINVAMKLFGETAFGLRFMPAVGGVLAIPAIYLLGRHLAGTRLALIAAAMLAISHTHIHFSRIASVAYIQDTWLIPLELYLLLSGLKKQELWRSGLAGVLLAAHYTVYLTSQIITALVLLFMLISLVVYRSWFRERLSHVWSFWGGFLIMIMPPALYIYRNPNQFFNRMTQDGTFQTNWLTLQMQNTGQGALEILLRRVVHAFLSLTYYPAFDFYGSPTPMMSVISSVLLFAGLGVILWRIRTPAYLLLNGYFWGSVVAVGVFALPPSADSYRMLMALPAAIIIASLGLDRLLRSIDLGWNESRKAYLFTVTAVMTSLLFFNMWTYYAEFAGQCRFPGSFAGRFASYLGTEIADVDNENRIYVLSDDIYRHGTHASTLFISENRPAINLMEPLETIVPVSGETIIATPNRITELQDWALMHPGGRLHYVYDCDTVILLSYRVP